MTFSRRAFLGGSAATVGGLVLADHLRFLQPVSGDAAAAEPTITSGATVYRTGHSNNCDGACGHLVHVVDGRVTMIGPASWGTKTVSGEHRRPPSTPASVCEASRRSRTPTARTGSSTPTSGSGRRGSGKWQRISWDEATSLIAENFTADPGRSTGRTSVWIAPYTGSLALIEGVVGAGFRFASVIGASAGDSEGDNEGDSATPAGWNYVLVDPTNPVQRRRFLHRPRVGRLPERQDDRLLGQQRRRDLDPGLADHVRRQGPERHPAHLGRPSLHGHLAASRTSGCRSAREPTPPSSTASSTRSSRTSSTTPTTSAPTPSARTSSTRGRRSGSGRRT